jgi:hypothetical protein
MIPQSRGKFISKSRRKYSKSILEILDKTMKHDTVAIAIGNSPDEIEIKARKLNIII